MTRGPIRPQDVTAMRGTTDLQQKTARNLAQKANALRPMDGSMLDDALHEFADRQAELASDAVDAARWLDHVAANLPTQKAAS
jgi:hypothetical protein